MKIEWRGFYLFISREGIIIAFGRDTNSSSFDFEFHVLRYIWRECDLNLEEAEK